MKIFKTINMCVLLIAGLVFLTASQACARSKDQIIQSMKDRISTINQLKASGIVGETNNGYLAFIGSADGRESIVAAENQDRKELYAIIAKEQHTSVEVIEKNMGVVKAQRAEPGNYYQKIDGTWVKK